MQKITGTMPTRQKWRWPNASKGEEERAKCQQGGRGEGQMLMLEERGPNADQAEGEKS